MKLKTETNTARMESRIVAAFEAWASGMTFEAHFEHGQWWVLAEDCDGESRTFSVVDASGGGSVDGFSFEEV